MTADHTGQWRLWSVFDVRCKCGDTYQMVNSGIAPASTDSAAEWVAKWVREHRCRL